MHFTGARIFRLEGFQVSFSNVRLRRHIFEVQTCCAARHSRPAPRHYPGHNPAGSLAVFLLPAYGAIVAASGLVVYGDTGGEWPEELHEAAAGVMLARVPVDVAGAAGPGKEGVETADLRSISQAAYVRRDH